MSWSWTERGLDQLASLCRDAERMGQMSAQKPTFETFFDAGTVRVPREATVDEVEPIMPRTRVKVKRLTNGTWQPEITVESFDADPLTIAGQMRIYRRLRELELLVAQAINQWEHPDPEAPVPT